MWKAEVNLELSSSDSSTCFLETGSYRPGIHQAGYPGCPWIPQGCSLPRESLCLPSSGLANVYHLQFFKWVLSVETQIFMLAHKKVYPPHHSQIFFEPFSPRRLLAKVSALLAHGHMQVETAYPIDHPKAQNAQ